MKKYLSIIFLVLIVAGCGKNNKNSQNAPQAFSLLSPAKDQACTTGTIVSSTQSKVAFTWNASTGASSYDITLTNLLTQNVTTLSSNTPTVTATLLQNTPYSWYITAKSGATTATTKSDVWKFYNSGTGVVTYPPFPAEILTPAFGASVTSTNGQINLTWKGSAVSNNIVGYYVYFGATNNPDLIKSNITDQFVNGVSVSPKTTYYWRVATVDSNGNISDSGTSTFYVSQ